MTKNYNFYGASSYSTVSSIIFSRSDPPITRYLILSNFLSFVLCRRNQIRVIFLSFPLTSKHSIFIRVLNYTLVYTRQKRGWRSSKARYTPFPQFVWSHPAHSLKHPPKMEQGMDNQNSLKAVPRLLLPQKIMHIHTYLIHTSQHGQFPFICSYCTKFSYNWSFIHMPSFTYFRNLY